MSTNLQTNNSRKWKFLSFTLAGILLASTTAAIFQVPQNIMNGSIALEGENSASPSVINAAYAAGALTNVFALPSDNIYGSETYYTIAFTTATTSSIKVVEMTFPAGFNVATAKLIQVQNIGGGSLSTSGQVVKYTISSPSSITAPKAIKIMVGGIVNPNFALNMPANQISVVTKEVSGPNQVIVDGPTKSALFTLIQVSNSMLGTNAVSAPKLASNAVDSSKVQDGTLARADMSLAFMKKNTIADCNSCNGGWIPDSSRKTFTNIAEPAVGFKSVIIVTTDTFGVDLCSAYVNQPASFNVTCEGPVSEGANLNYVVIN